MAPLSNQQFKAFVGIDWADTKHDICLQQAGDDRREFDCIPHQVTRIDEWAKALHQRFGGPIAIALELARGPIVSVLQKHAFFTLFPINPAMLAKYREAFKPSRAKDDPTDYRLLTIPVIVAPHRLLALMLVAQLRTALAAIDVFDKEIATVARTLPDFDLFDSLPGAGPHLTPRLLAAFGEQRDRFKGADELQKYSGIAPVTERIIRTARF